MRFYLGTHKPAWLARRDVAVPLFVSTRSLRDRATLPRAVTGWALDSGGFTELSGRAARWLTTVEQYVAEVQRYADEIGRLEWAAPQDSMCDPFVLANTGRTVAAHQHATVENYLDLRGRGPFIPVLQGWTVDDYLRCVDLYASAGVNLAAEPLVGVGSIAARQDTLAAATVVRELAALGLRLHGFGVKASGLAVYADSLVSSDSVAWSLRARRDYPLPGCKHASCNNCPRYALRWRDGVLRDLLAERLFDPAAL